MMFRAEFFRVTNKLEFTSVQPSLTAANPGQIKGGAEPTHSPVRAEV